jgi:hypothetical protein
MISSKLAVQAAGAVEDAAVVVAVLVEATVMPAQDPFVIKDREMQGVVLHHTPR